MKKLKAVAIALALFAPLAANAAGSIQVGTAPLLLGLGVTNVYAQFPLGDQSAVQVTYATINGSYSGGTLNASTYSASYKKYFSEYANGGFWQVGAASLNVTASTVSTITGNATWPILIAGYEKTFSKHFVLGAEGGLGTGGGWGFLGVNAAYQF